jgi:hypothetical protein
MFIKAFRTDTDRQTERKTDRKTDRQTDRQTPDLRHHVVIQLMYFIYVSFVLDISNTEKYVKPVM